MRRANTRSPTPQWQVKGTVITKPADTAAAIPGLASQSVCPLPLHPRKDSLYGFFVQVDGPLAKPRFNPLTTEAPLPANPNSGQLSALDEAVYGSRVNLQGVGKFFHRK